MGVIAIGHVTSRWQSSLVVWIRIEDIEVWANWGIGNDKVNSAV